jgi:hypothetical protein
VGAADRKRTLLRHAFCVGLLSWPLPAIPALPGQTARSSTAPLGQGGRHQPAPPQTRRISRTRSRTWSSTPGYRQFH